MTPWTTIDATGTPDPQAPRFSNRRRASGMRVIFIAAGTLVLAVATADAKPTPVQKCAVAKNKTAGKYAACLQTATANFVTSADDAKFLADRIKCQATFKKGWATADAKAAKVGAICADAPATVDDFDESVDRQRVVIGNAISGQGLERCGDDTLAGSESCDGADLGDETCATLDFALGTLRCGSGCTFDTSGCFATRYEDNGDGTVTDHQTGLQWEQKTALDSTANLADPHDADNRYSWTATLGGTTPNGTAFTDFLPKLNGGSDDGVTLTGCFAGHCDWRLPTIVELKTILKDPFPCGTNPCIAPVFGATVGLDYWSATTDATDPGGAWAVGFDRGVMGPGDKNFDLFVRAVRAGS